jgi:hypothetical protein
MSADRRQSDDAARYISRYIYSSRNDADITAVDVAALGLA